MFLWQALKIRKALKARGILGMNQRNADFILPFNQRKYYPLVDNKCTTKTLATKAGVRVPEVYMVVEIEKQIETLHHFLEKQEDFVLKPASGSGGSGGTPRTHKQHETPHWHDGGYYHWLCCHK